MDGAEIPHGTIWYFSTVTPPPAFYSRPCIRGARRAACLLRLIRVFFLSPQYDVVGHSGDGYDIELVRADKVPKNNKDRLKVLKVHNRPRSVSSLRPLRSVVCSLLTRRLFPALQNMHAHSQFCMSGDFTLEGTDASIKELAREEADEHFVVVLSDANLERYGIRPERFARVLTADPQVNAFAIFIGSLGDQAER